MKVPLALDDGLAETWYDFLDPGDCRMGDGDVKCKQGETGPVCPECGTPRSERTPAVPWFVRHRLRVKCAALLIVLGFIGWQNMGAWPPMFKPRVRGTLPASLLAHKYTRSTLEQYASGEIADGQLIADVQRPFLMGTYELDAGFHSPKGVLSSVTWHGWPAILVTHQYHGSYDDVYAKINASPGATPSINGWRGLAYMRQSIDSKGRFAHFSFVVYQFIIPAVVVMFAFALGGIVRWALIALRVAARDHERIRDRFAARLPLLCALVCVIGIAIGSLVPMHYPDMITPANTAITSTKVGLTNDDLARLAQTPAGEAAFARAVLDATTALPANPNDALAIGWSSEQGMTVQEGRGGWLDLMMYTHHWNTQAADSGRTGWPRLSIRRNTTTLDILLRWGEPLARYEDYSLVMYPASKLLASLFAAWWTPGVAAMIARWWAIRRAKKRAGAVQCVRCGYDLKGI